MANYVESIKAGSGESWPVRDAEAHTAIDTLERIVDTAQVTAENVHAALAGCWIEFTDEDGNATDEPYIHWLEEVSE